MDIDKYLHQLSGMGQKLMYTLPFIAENKLWEGFFKNKFVVITSVLAAIFIPYTLFKWMGTIIAEISASAHDTKGFAMASLPNTTNFLSVFEGGNKYLILILIQMLVVHFSNKTIEHLSGVVIDMSLKEMIQSQFRVVVVVIRNWIIELVLGIGISIFIGIFGPDWLTEVLKYILGCYFVGYLFIDNYNHTFGIGIKESTNVVRKHAGAALLIGLVTKLLFLIPYAGAVIASFVCGVSSTWYMHTSDDRHAGKEAFI